MPICTHCGAQNPNDVTRCTKCGVALGHQARVKADAQRTQIASVARTIAWVVAVVILLLVARPAYHAAFAGYYRYRLNTVKESAIKACGGPITDTTQSYKKDEIDRCLDSDAVLQTAQTDYSNYTKGDKP